MHIAMDARMMGAGKTRGIGRYIEETVRAALEVDPDLRFTLIIRDLVGTPFASHPRVDHVVADIPWYSFREQFRMAPLLEGIGADLIHIPHWNVPLRLQKPFVMTVHDLLLLRQSASAKTSTKGFLTRTVKQFGFRWVIRHALESAKKMFVPTAFVAGEIGALAHVPLSRLLVTGEGLTHFSKPDARLCPSSPYLLYVGSAYPHKRLDVLVSTWEKISEAHPEYELVMAGEMDVFMTQIKYQATNSKYFERIRFLGRVTDAELAGLYTNASVFIFPSSHEGFGLPPLEALSFGCPVVSSDIPCLREVLPKEGVEWFRDGDEHDMMRALERTLQDLSRARQQAVIGKEWVVAHHVWRMSAKRLIEGYRSIVETL